MAAMRSGSSISRHPRSSHFPEPDALEAAEWSGSIRAVPSRPEGWTTPYNRTSATLIAILFEQIQASVMRMQTLSRHLVEVQEGERCHVTHELQAEAGQALESLHNGLCLLEREADEGGSISARAAAPGHVDGASRQLDREHRHGAPVEALTRREIEVLRLLARGNTNLQTANLLGLSVRTVENHRANLLGKLGLVSRVELVNYAEEHNLL